MPSSRDKEQYIAITVDFCSGVLGSRSDSDYKTVFDGTLIIDSTIRKTFTREGIKFTFFVRADNQIKYHFDRVSYLFDYYRSFWLEVKHKGDEIGWHPHLYKLRGNTWTPQTDGPGVEGQLKNCFVELPMDVFFISCARLGEGMMSNYAVNTLDRMGLKVDSTALPGRIRNDAERRFDWRKAPLTPYHPSRFDYSSPGLPGGSLNLLEVPFTMATTMASYDTEPIKRYLDLSFDPSILGPGLKEAIKSSPYTIAVIHPAFILGAAGDHDLITPGEDTVKQNIANIMAAAKMVRRTPKFVRVRDIYDAIKGEGGGEK